MPALDSTNLASCEYDPETKVLKITFKTGAVYAYSGVPEEVYEGLLSSPSAGSYFYRHIRDVFPFERIA